MTTLLQLSTRDTIKQLFQFAKKKKELDSLKHIDTTCLYVNVVGTVIENDESVAKVMSKHDQLGCDKTHPFKIEVSNMHVQFNCKMILNLVAFRLRGKMLIMYFSYKHYGHDW